MSDERAALRRFVHDARTPLTVVGGFAELLLRGGDEMRPEDRHAALARIVEAAGDLRALLDRLEASGRPPQKPR